MIQEDKGLRRLALYLYRSFVLATEREEVHGTRREALICAIDTIEKQFPPAGRLSRRMRYPGEYTYECHTRNGSVRIKCHRENETHSGARGASPHSAERVGTKRG